MNVVFYTREGCHLCDQALEDLNSLRDKYAFELIVIDIDDNENLQETYGMEIPVVKVGPYTLRAPFTASELAMTLGAAADRERHIDMVEKSPALEEVRKNAAWTFSDRFTYGLSKHYIAVFNVFVAIYLGLSFLAPVLMKTNATAPAGLLYRVYGLVCHQLSYRSFFLYGEQWVYPRAAAGLDDIQTYQQASLNNEGSSPQDIFLARNFRGNETMGYKVALCQRDVAIYGAILLFGLLFALSGRRIPALPWYLWIIIGLVPIGLDGVSQLISQPPLNFIPFRESTPYLRVLTGALFGFATAWFGYPLVEETMAETRELMARKRAQIQNRGSLG